MIAIVARADDARTRERSGGDRRRATSSIALAAERAFLAALDGSCRTPIGGYARVAGLVTLKGIIIKPDGSEAHEIEAHGPFEKAASIGAEAGAELLHRGGADFFRG